MAIPFVKIVGRLAITAADLTTDVDDEPNIVTCDSGKVIFTPLVSEVKVETGMPLAPFTASNDPIVASINSEGQISLNGVPYVKLIDLKSPLVNPHIPEGASYRVSFDSVRAGTKAVKFAPFTIEPLPGVDNDLTKMWPASFAGAIPILRGEIGPEGPAGDVGPQGEQGLQGEQGPQGEQGVEGPQGIQGIQGPEGPEGPQGIRGDRGLDGPEGPAGPQGEQGLQGEDGPQGPQGEVGPQGPEGPQGAKGDVGATGINFLNENWSSTKDYVEDDAISHNGASWIAASDPPIGDEPRLESTFWRPLSMRGDQGPQGIQGQPGPQGIKGDTGSQGTQGIQGVKGDTGAAGPKGDTGAKGDQGIQGIQGIKGDTGSQGVQGIQGPQGPQGPQGVQGQSGTPLVNITSVSGNYTLALSDAFGEVDFAGGGGQTCTIPQNADVPFQIGTTIEIVQAGAGAVTIAGVGVVVVLSRSSAFKTNGQNAVAAIRKIGTDTWRVMGDVIA